jgi:DNA integrity scanning protein DisA with diadenylate cyclase activity
MTDPIHSGVSDVAYEPLLARAAELENALGRMAAAHGYPSYAHMRQRLAVEGGSLSARSRARLLKDLRRLAPDVEQVQQALPAVDATGLVAVHDLVKSVARLIRVLLVGYTDDEVDELKSRGRAQRAFQAQVAGEEVEEQHASVILGMEALTKPRTMKGTR